MGAWCAGLGQRGNGPPAVRAPHAGRPALRWASCMAQGGVPNGLEGTALYRTPGSPMVRRSVGAGGAGADRGGRTWQAAVCALAAPSPLAGNIRLQVGARRLCARPTHGPRRDSDAVRLQTHLPCRGRAANRSAPDPPPCRRDGSYCRIEPMIFSRETLSVIMRCLTAAAYHVRYQRVASATSGSASAP